MIFSKPMAKAKKRAPRVARVRYSEEVHPPAISNTPPNISLFNGANFYHLPPTMIVEYSKIYFANLPGVDLKEMVNELWFNFGKLCSTDGAAKSNEIFKKYLGIDLPFDLTLIAKENKLVSLVNVFLCPRKTSYGHCKGSRTGDLLSKIQSVYLTGSIALNVELDKCGEIQPRGIIFLDAIPYCRLNCFSSKNDRIEPDGECVDDKLKNDINEHTNEQIGYLLLFQLLACSMAGADIKLLRLAGNTVKSAFETLDADMQSILDFILLHADVQCTKHTARLFHSHKNVTIY
jgi:hypothetical protein